MGTVISFVNTKGGVGKSTLAVHLAVWLADRGCRVALLDADDQATAAKWVAEITDHAVRVEKLAAADDNTRGEEVRTKINALSKAHDFVIVDTKGSAALPTSAAVIKSDLAFIPLQASASDIWPIEKALSVIRLSKEARRGKPEASLILNLTDDRDVVAKDVRNLAKKYGISVARTNIKRLNAYRDAAGNRTVATRLNDPRGRAAGKRLSKLFDELLRGRLRPKLKRAANA